MHRGSEMQFVARWHSPRVLQITEGKKSSTPDVHILFFARPNDFS
jgi:hypothetical protein